MKKYLLVLVALLVTMFASNSYAYTPPTPDGYVMDMAGKLTSDQKAQLNAKLDNISKTTKNEFAALIVPSMDGETIEDVAQDTFKSWKIGKAGLDNGVLIVIAVAERKSRIQTGKGVEGDLTDLQANDILRNNLNPHLRSGDFYGGLNESFDVIARTIESRGSTPLPPNPRNEQNTDAGVVVLVLLAFGGIVGLIVFLLVSSNKKEQRKLQAQLDRDRVKSAVVTAGIVAEEARREARLREEEENRRRREQERRRREQEEEDRRQRDREEESSRSSYDSDDSSISSGISDILDVFGGGSSDDSGFGGFGGGDSGGGGSSSDW